MRCSPSGKVTVAMVWWYKKASLLTLVTPGDIMREAIFS
jgi:hypothetical protein